MTGPGVLTRALSGIALVSLLAIGLPQGSAPAAADETSERLVRTRTSLLGTHTWYQQTYRDVDVLDGVVGIHAYRGGGTSKVDGRKSVADAPPVAPTVTAAQARATAGPQAGDALLAIKAGSPSRLVWAVTSVGPSGATRTLVDARDGMVLEVKRIQHDADGRGTVFDPNPVVTLKDQTLTDAGDANLPVFGPSYRSVPLRHLDGSGYLRGDYAVVSPLTEPPAFSPSLVFDTDRSSPAFEQAMAYFHVTTSQEYIQSLGFVDANNRPTRVVPDGTSDDASFAVPDAVGTTLYFGTGGVDDAEDADIIWHEYGHAILADQVFGFPGVQTRRP